MFSSWRTSPSDVTPPAAIVVPPTSTPIKMGGPEMAPHTPPRSGDLGEPAAPLDIPIYSSANVQSVMPSAAAAARAAGVPRPTISVSRWRP